MKGERNGHEGTDGSSEETIRTQHGGQVGDGASGQVSPSGKTWEIVFDTEEAGEDGGGKMTSEDACQRIRTMLDEDGGVGGIAAFLEETAEGFVTDDGWRAIGASRRQP